MDGVPAKLWLYKGHSGYWFVRIETNGTVIYMPTGSWYVTDRLQLAGCPVWEDHSDYMKVRR